MTFAQSQIGRTVSRAGSILKRQFWLWPLLAILVLSSLGYIVHRAISTTMKESLASQLQTLLSVEAAMLENWYDVQKSTSLSIANNTLVRDAVEQLVNSELQGSGSEFADLVKMRQVLDRALVSLIDRRQFDRYFIMDASQKIIASTNDEMLGKDYITQYSEFIAKALDGETVVSAPFTNMLAQKDATGQYRAGAPTMFVASPIRDEHLQVIGVLALKLPPEREFTRILQIGRIGESGETYAFNQDGLMVSNSRFDHDLILAGLLADQPDSRSILNLLIRDPGGDMTRGFRPTVRRTELPLTKMALEATAGRSGYDVEGYNDYRGVPVVGAWKWMPGYSIGLTTEIDYAEAFRPLTILSWMFWGLYAMLFIASIVIFAFTFVVNRMQREAQKAAIEAQELGQYKLEQKLGAGAMGIVYKGYHAMMRRPTAIKLLNVETVSDAAISRFEKEVQITCLLNHPNTIAIYDYGRTPEGVFYYAMEYLDGIDLQRLIDEYGPQPEGRVIQILLQICGSLYEAHAQGLVHRDIKPANIMLNRRGGQPDVVKVLDFGLVKQIDASNQEVGLAGTPLYMSPEAIQSPTLVDACSDLYALGAVGYFFITGKSVFEASSIVELLQKHVTETPIAPSHRGGIMCLKPSKM